MSTKVCLCKTFQDKYAETRGTKNTNIKMWKLIKGMSDNFKKTLYSNLSRKYINKDGTSSTNRIISI